jgi:hypothetical protein
MNPDGTGRTKISDGAAIDTHPCWAPDGNKIAFVVRPIANPYGPSSGIWVMNPDGSGRAPLVTGPYDSPEYSPDGTKIVFSGPDGIYVMSSDGTNMTLLGALAGGAPDWSPDGTKIVYSVGSNDIYVMDADGSNQIDLSGGDPEVYDGDPTWSPDGTRIAFYRGLPGDPHFAQIWVMNADGSDPTNVSPTGAEESGPDWQRVPGPPAIVCPSAVSVFTGQGECSAVAEFAARATGYPTPTFNCTPASGTLFPLGTTTVTCTATNGVAPDATCSFDIVVMDGDPPSVAGASASPSVLWTPNHRMVDVEVAYTASDTCSGAVACALSVASNEPESGLGNGDVAPDWQVVDAHHVRLRAERSGTGSGRVYTITITCTDTAGNSSTAAVTVSVPRGR